VKNIYNNDNNDDNNNNNNNNSWAKSSTITNVPYSMQIPRACLLILGDRMSSFPWLTLILWDRVKVSKQINAEKCDLME